MPKKISTFEFERSANDELANIVVRAYKIHLSCGGEVNEEVEKMVEAQRQRKKEGDDEKKLDAFERLKVDIAKECKIIDDKINIKLKEPGPEINTQIQSKFLRVKEFVVQLEALQLNAKNTTGIWAVLKRKPKPEILDQRDEDIRNIKEYIISLQDKNRGTKTLKLENKSHTNVDNLEDLSGESGIPGVDISEGIKQIEDNKRKIEEALGELISQVEKMKESAENFSQELDKQEKLLDKIGQDVEKYDKQLGELNKTMDKALAAVGGPLKIILMIIILIIVLAIIAVVYVVVEQLVK